MYRVSGSIRVLEVMVDRMSPFRDFIKEDGVKRSLYSTTLCALKETQFILGIKK
jgi:hypothetical protein